MVSLLMESRIWETMGWTMIHFLWVGSLIGMFAAAGRLVL